MKRFLIAAAVMTVAAAPALANSSTIMQITRTDKTVTGQPIISPEHPTVIATVLTLQPGDRTPEHKHPYPHYGYVLDGTLTVVNTETGKSFELAKGAFLVEMMNTAHYGENRGKQPVSILIIDSVPAGTATNSVPVKP